MPIWFAVIFAAAAAITGAAAAVVGAGVDSVLTPLLSLQMDMRTCVLAVTAPHLAFNALRFHSLRKKVDRRILKRFGITSAAGALVGSLAHQAVESRWITITFAVLLILAGLFGATGLSEKVHFGKRGAYLGGALSGFFGGLTGEQGGLRAAALLGFELRKEAFVATATAAALIVDVVRTPIYIATRFHDLRAAALPALIGTAGVVAGTFAGKRLLKQVPQDKFDRVVSWALLGIGVLLGVRSFVGK
jgi:uncharacterized membrane protein YfcA